MARHARTRILSFAAAVGLAGAFVPALALPGGGADRGVPVFHRTVGLTQTDLRDPDAVTAAIDQVAGSVYGPRGVHASLRTPLSQFTRSVGAQARWETWASLVLEVWMGGDGSPAGYYVQYQGRTASGGLVNGASFLASPDSPQTLRLARGAGLVARMIGGDGSPGAPEFFLVGAGR